MTKWQTYQGILERINTVYTEEEHKKIQGKPLLIVDAQRFPHRMLPKQHVAE